MSALAWGLLTVVAIACTVLVLIAIGLASDDDNGDDQ